jgi:hypothetical protein
MISVLVFPWHESLLGEAAVLFYLTSNFVVLPQVTDKPILIYPNSGERYDGEKKEWVVSSLSKAGLIHI